MSNLSFYKDLPYVDNFEDLTNLKLFREVPPDWFVLISDVQNSTVEIEEGRYHEVNFVGAAAITAIINIDKRLDIPFVFGGDGATILVPPSIIEKAEDAYRDVKKFSEDKLGLHLRIAKIPVIDVHRSKNQIKVSKLKVANNYYQPVFSGGGLDYAEYLAKKEKRYLIKPIPVKYHADFSGLECIWEDIPGKSDEVVNILVKATIDNVPHGHVYNEVLQQIRTIYGTKADRFPVDLKRLKSGFSLKKVELESLLYSYQFKMNYHVSFLRRFIGNVAKSVFQLFKTISLFIIRKKSIDLRLSTVDSEKFDDMLRMVITGTKEQRENLIDFLEYCYKKRYLAYGIHVTHSAYMTCLIFERNGKQVRFIDGSNGGYTLAAKELKNKVKWLKTYL